jgi:predicted RNase H-like HicB family nuclease
MIAEYPARFVWEDDCWQVFFLDFELATYGLDIEEALAMAIEAVELVFLCKIEDRDEIPMPSKLISHKAMLNELILPVPVDFARIAATLSAESKQSKITVSYVPAEPILTI